MCGLKLEGSQYRGFLSPLQIICVRPVIYAGNSKIRRGLRHSKYVVNGKGDEYWSWLSEYLRTRQN